MRAVPAPASPVRGEIACGQVCEGSSLRAPRLACPLRFTNVIESSYADDPLSIGSDAVDQATMAAILAAVGRNSLNEKEVLRSARVPAIVAPLHFAAFASSVKGAPGD